MKFTQVINLLMTYDKKLGSQAHLVVETGDLEPLGDKVVSVDLGETQIISAIFDPVKHFCTVGEK